MPENQLTPKHATFGKPLSKKEADAMFNSFLSMKDSSNADLKKIFKGKAKELRYFTGRKDPQTQNETFDIAYVFDRENLERLLGKLKQDEAGGLIFFQGIRDKVKDSDDVDGRPTLMVFTFAYDLKNNPSTDLILKVSTDGLDGNDGEEHPGNDQLDMTKINIQMERGIPNPIPVENITLR